MRAIVPHFKTNPFAQNWLSEFEDFFHSPSLNSTPEEKSSFSVACGAEENDDQILLSFDIPGVKEKDIKVRFENSVLTVSGERQEEKETSQDNLRFFSERKFGSFTRRFKLPTSVDAEKISADYSNGVLQVILPKKEQEKPKEIEIKVL